MKPVAIGVKMHSGWGILVTVCGNLNTAEGEFFRSAIEKGFDHLKLSVTRIRERDLDRLAETVLGDAAGQLPNAIAGLRLSLGPPWTKDHKLAAVAAAILLNDQFAAHRAYD